MEEKHFSAGQTIFSEGDASDCAYTIRSGRVEILKATEGGAIRLAVLGKDDVLGEMGLLDERPRSATARALDDVVADAISPAVFSRLLLTEPKRVLRLLRALFERLRTTNRMVAEYAEPSTSDSPHPRVTLVPLSPQTKAALPAEGLELSRFPFRIGRKPGGQDASALSFNDLELADDGSYVLSLNHFSVDVDSVGVLVRDRGAQHGTSVNGTRIGASASRDVARLHPGENEVIAGPAAGLLHPRGSPFRFKIVVE